MSEKLLAILLTLLGSILGVAGDFFVKSAGMNGRTDWKLLAIASVIWMSTIPVWFYAFRYMKMSILGVLYSLFIVIMLVAIGIFYFHESLTMMEWIGIGFAVAALGLLARFL